MRKSDTRVVDWGALRESIEKLQGLAAEADDPSIRAELKRIVPEYQPNQKGEDAESPTATIPPGSPAATSDVPPTSPAPGIDVA